MIIGASKAGTTSLFEYLSRHPNVQNARMKEPRFFNRYFHLGRNYYRSYFPKMSTSGVTGEATTSYLYEKNVPKRIKEMIPNVKLIVLLRDPVKRAYSHYNMNKLDDSSTNFQEALLREKRGEVRFYYLESSMYHKQLSRWMNYFDRDQILLLKSEEMFKQQEKTQQKILSFLDLEILNLGSFKKLNERTYSALSEKVYNEVNTYFEDNLKALKANFGIEWN